MPHTAPRGCRCAGLSQGGEHPQGTLCSLSNTLGSWEEGASLGQIKAIRAKLGENWEKNCYVLRSPKKAEPAPQSLQLKPSPTAPGTRRLPERLLVTAGLGLLRHPSGSQTQGGSPGVSANWSFVGEERDCKRGNIRTSDSPKHRGRCLATPLGALLGWYQESKAAAGEGAGV